jgi:hypothetical protein
MIIGLLLADIEILGLAENLIYEYFMGLSKFNASFNSF